MDDGAEVHLKEDSVLKISEYVITAGYDEGSSSIFDLLRGGLRKLTGSIGASALANYQVQTGLATIGIRGTEYVIKLCKLDDCSQTVSRNDPDAKLHAVVLKGAITLTTDKDVQILMAMGEYGTATPEVLVVEGRKAGACWFPRRRRITNVQCHYPATGGAGRRNFEFVDVGGGCATARGRLIAGIKHGDCSGNRALRVVVLCGKKHRRFSTDPGSYTVDCLALWADLSAHSPHGMVPVGYF